MYGSYGSYSSMRDSAPLDIPASSYLSTPSHNTHCAFPSWPRRDSLSESDCGRATSYLSDDDLFPTDMDDDAHSIASNSSYASPDWQSPVNQPVMTEAELLEIQRERAAMQREAVRFLVLEKERRRQAAKKHRKAAASSSKKSPPKSKLASMTPITEAGE